MSRVISIAFFLFLVLIRFRACAITYEYISDGYFTSIHVLIVDPKEHIMIPVRASDEKNGRETVADLCNRYGAVAAINGGFWKTDGSPAGALKINHEWFGTPVKPRGAIGWSCMNQKVLIDRILTDYSLEECPEDSSIEVIPVSTPPTTTSEEWKDLEHIVGGTPVLVRNGIAINDFRPEQTLESFLTKKHPRTAIGIRGDGIRVFVAVDGRFRGVFGGMTMKELSQLMLELGCVEALNLDGGGSTTMVLEGKVINVPCGSKKEGGKNVETVSDAILIF